MFIRRSKDRGYFDHGWLKTHHTFSFGDYYDPSQMGFRTLRVINEDFVEPGNGFPTHSHRDMEIITYIMSGALAHKDSMGNGSTIKPGEVQYMSAGSGVTHSEINNSSSEQVHLMQIWILPSEKGAEPRYAQTKFDSNDQIGKWLLIVSKDGREKSISIRQDADIYASILPANTKLSLPILKDRNLWVHIVRGEVSFGEEALKAGDAFSLEANEKILNELRAGSEGSEILLFSLT